jgi:hypothetical protein
MWSYSTQVQLELMFAIIRRLKWPLIFLFYDILIYWQPLPAVILLAGLMAAAFQVYQMDLAREQEASDDFRRDGLFYRYGARFAGLMWQIPVKHDWDGGQVKDFAESLRGKLAERLHKRLPADAVQIMEPVAIKDKDLETQKEFTRVLAKTSLGSIVVYFLHYASFGRSITLHFDSFARGTHGWFDVAKFIAASPLTIWFWGLKWWRNEASIVSRISHFSGNSYDEMDVDTIVNTTYQVILNELRDLLEEEGILTPELKQMLVQQITNVQNFSVSQSSGVTIGSLSQSAVAPVSPQKAA